MSREQRSAANVLGHPDVRDVPVHIYALSDPDGTVRYVGKSDRPEYRLFSHCHRGAAMPVGKWTAELEAAGESPGLEILHTVPPGEDAAPWELLFIRAHRQSGKLLNALFRAELVDVKPIAQGRLAKGPTKASVALRAALSMFGAQMRCSELTGICNTRISKMTRGIVIPRADEAHWLERVTGVPVAWWAEPAKDSTHAA